MGGVGVLLFAASRICVAWIRGLGVQPSGDEPHYLVSALAIGRFHTLQVDQAYRYAIAHHLFGVGATPFGPAAFANGSVQVVQAHGGSFPYHEVGLPLLLAVPVALGGLTGASIGFSAITAALTTWVVHLTGVVSGVRSPWRAGVAVVFLSPAYLLATTQLYPDLVSGLVVAVLVLLVARTEVSGAISAVELATFGLLAGFLPWLHDKNFLVAAVLSLVAAVVVHRARPPVRALPWAIVPAGALWGSLLAYNSYVFGKLDGPGGAFTFDLATWTRIVAQVVDRRQGLLLQLVAVLLGCAGLWLSRRRIPVSVVTAIVTVVLLVALNGTLTNSFGGFSFVGRLQWEAAPVLLAFAGLYLLALADRPRPLMTVGGLLGAATAVEWITVVATRTDLFSFYNAYDHYAIGYWTRDPYIGWWGPLDPFSPVLGDVDQSWHAIWAVGRNWWGTAFVLSAASLLVVLLVRAAAPPPRRRAPAVAVLGVLAIVTAAGTAVASPAQLRVEVFPGATLATRVGTPSGTSMVVQGAAATGALVYGPDAVVVPGRYVATFTYRLVGTPQRADVTWASSPTAPAGVVARSMLPPSTSPASIGLGFDVSADGVVQTRVFWTGGTSMEIDRVTLVRTGP